MPLHHTFGINQIGDLQAIQPAGREELNISIKDSDASF